MRESLGGRATVLFAISLLAYAADACAASTYVRQSSSSVSLPTAPGTPAQILTVGLPAGNWLISANLRALAGDDFGNYLRCTLATPKSTIAFKEIAIYHSNGSSPFADYRQMSVAGGVTLTAPTFVTLSCSVDYTATNPTGVDQAALIASPVASFK